MTRRWRVTEALNWIAFRDPLRPWLPADPDAEAKVHDAFRQLCSALMERRLQIWARGLGTGSEEREVSSVVTDKGMALWVTGEIGPQLPGPGYQPSPEAPRYRDASFEPDELQKLWPESSSTASDEPKVARRPVYSDEALNGWFLLRVRGWPKDAPPPNADACLAAARQHFEGAIPRDPFRRIRRMKTPESWRKTGPRGPR